MRPQHSPVEAGVLLTTGLAAGLVLAAAGQQDSPWLAGVALLLALTLVVNVPVPWGGSVPLGFALAAALPTLTPLADVLTVTALAMAVVGTGWRKGWATMIPVVARLAPPCLGAVVAVAAVRSAMTDPPVLLEVAAASGFLLLVEANVTRQVAVNGKRLELLPALPVYLTVACGAALIAVATDGFGVTMALIAAFPLLITRFSFQRYARATVTLRQTVQALGLVPELAGLAPLGHSERSAFYAEALARELGLRRTAVDRVVTASRLHHLGAVPFDPVDPRNPGVSTPPDPAAVADQGGAILRESGFPSDVADLVQEARAGALDGVAPSVEAAVVRVASAFDEVVGDDETLTDRALALVGSTSRDQLSRRAAAALLELVATRPTLVTDAIATGATFRDAASGLELDALVAGTRGGEILPFVRRRA